MYVQWIIINWETKYPRIISDGCGTFFIVITILFPRSSNSYLWSLSLISQTVGTGAKYWLERYNNSKHSLKEGIQGPSVASSLDCWFHPKVKYLWLLQINGQGRIQITSDFEWLYFIPQGPVVWRTICVNQGLSCIFFLLIRSVFFANFLYLF